MTEQVKFKSPAELAAEDFARREDNARSRRDVNELLALLNPDGGNYATELTVMTPNGPKAYNVSPLFTALIAQFQHFNGFTHDQNQITLSPQAAFFPHVESEVEGMELIKRHYHFDCAKRHVRMILTFATVNIAPEGRVLGLPHEEREFLHLTEADNFTWRSVVNWIARQFNQQQYVHLYGHNFEYIWDSEKGVNSLIPTTTEEEPNPLCTIGVQ